MVIAVAQYRAEISEQNLAISAGVLLLFVSLSTSLQDRDGKVIATKQNKNNPKK